jgi:hypothetical protein
MGISGDLFDAQRMRGGKYEVDEKSITSQWMKRRKRSEMS